MFDMCAVKLTYAVCTLYKQLCIYTSCSHLTVLALHRSYTLHPDVQCTECPQCVHCVQRFETLVTNQIATSYLETNRHGVAQSFDPSLLGALETKQK